MLISDLGLCDNVKLLGYVTNLQDYYHIVDVVVSCSKREGLPLNIVEAMLSGVPVVASHNRGHDELINDGENGFLINDLHSLSDKIRLLFRDEKIKERICNNGLKQGSFYSSTNTIKELRNIYFTD